MLKDSWGSTYDGRPTPQSDQEKIRERVWAGESLEQAMQAVSPDSYVKQKAEFLQNVSAVYRELLLLLGEEPDSSALKGTPDRIARFWDEFIHYEPGNIGTTFDSVQHDQMVVIKDIPFFSLCAHHLLPIVGVVHVGYLAADTIIGLSKIPRIVQKHAHRLQLQEQLANDVATELMEHVPDALGVGVYIEARHFCMSMRGIRSEGSMVTSVMKGNFQQLEVKTEFFTMAGVG